MARGGRTGGQYHPDLPLLPAPLIGRQIEVAAGRELLAGGARLVTLTGPPGVGKTSLALALGADQAARFADGATMVDLSPVADPALVGPTIADVFGASGRRRPVERLVAMLRRRELLLVLDNFEQVVAAAPVVSELLAGCPGVTILATSRIPLRLRWEHELPVPPLGLPDPAGPLTVAAVASAPAVRLFVERARAAGPAFALTDRNAAAVARICERLDGLPLAIELAAARARVLAPAAMLQQLSGADQRAGAGATGDGQVLGLLSGGLRDLPARQQTLRQAIAWSHALLDPAEQRLFRRLAVFSGGGTLDGVERVCEASWTEVASLVEKSLLRVDASDDDLSGDARAGGSQPRVRMLELVRAYAQEQLEASGEAEAIRQRHVRFFVELAEQIGPRIFSRDQADWLARLEQERDNLQAAERWAAQTGDVESVLRLGAALFRFWRTRSDAATAREHVQAILALAAEVPRFHRTTTALVGASELAVRIGDYAAAQSLTERSLAIARQLDDPLATATTLRQLIRLAGIRGTYQEADRLGAESLVILEQHGDLAALTDTLRELGLIRYLAGDPTQARALFERGLTVARQLGDPQTIDNLTFGVALTHHVTGEIETARRLYAECLAIDRAIGHRSAEGSALNNLGHLAILRGDLKQARGLLKESLLASREGGDRRRLAFTLSAVAGLVAAEGTPEQALRLDAAGIAALDSMGTTLASAMRELYNQQLQPASAALGPERAASAVAAGRALTLDEAVDEALAWLDESIDTSEAGRPTVLTPRASAPAHHDPTHDDPAIGVDTGGVGPPPAITRRTARPGPAAPGGLDRLTPRERDVAGLIARGCTNRQIADALVITPGTASNYVQRVMNRLGFHNRAQVAAWAAEHGLHADRA